MSPLKILFILLVLIVVMFAAYNFISKNPDWNFFGRLNTNNASATPQPQAVTGNITKVDGKRITVVDLQGTELKLETAPDIKIVKIIKVDVNATPSSDLSTIDLNQQVLINLSAEGKVTNITYLPTLPPPPPVNQGAN